MGAGVKVFTSPFAVRGVATIDSKVHISAQQCQLAQISQRTLNPEHKALTA
jgi:hypothetical protein